LGLIKDVIRRKMGQNPGQGVGWVSGRIASFLDAEPAGVLRRQAAGAELRPEHIQDALIVLNLG
jgi:hypothetical protein